MGRQPTPAEDRFWPKVAKTDGCWEWTGYREPFGYGRFRPVGGAQLVRTHRFSWELANGPIPPDMHVLHRCDNPPCVRPDHLFLGSHTDNVQDCIAKGRYDRSPRHTGAKLSAQQAEEIRRRYAVGGVSKSGLAEEYGVSRRTIATVVRRPASECD